MEEINLCLLRHSTTDKLFWTVPGADGAHHGVHIQAGTEAGQSVGFSVTPVTTRRWVCMMGLTR